MRPFLQSCPCLAFVFALAFCVPAAADCPAALRSLGYAPGDYRPLPELLPGPPSSGKPAALSFDMVLYRFAAPRPPGPPAPQDHLTIGNYSVSNVSGMVFAPKAGSHLEMAPSDGSAPRPLDASCLDDPSIVYGGTSWHLVQGGALEATLTSRLDFQAKDLQAPVNGGVPCRSSNVHTHGLLVRPTRAEDPTKDAYGDYVLDVTLAKGAKAGGDDCAAGAPLAAAHHHGVIAAPMRYDITIPGKPGENGLGPHQHPSGLFWYHPHPHGYSRTQVSGGTTGLITVGGLADYACLPDALLPAGPCKKVDLAGFRVRTVELKDAQISPFGPQGGWRLNAAYDSHACKLVLAPGELRNGECQGATTDSGDHTGLKWVVTVNGLQFPTVRAQIGKGEIWRIANASPNFTYDLSIVPTGSTSAAGTDFQVLAVDGVSVDQEPDKIGARRHLLLMPGSRVEVLVKEPSGGGEYVLRNNLVSTGASDSADIWPIVDLMKVVWPARLAEARLREGEVAAASVRVLRVKGPARAPLSVTSSADQRGIAGRCQYFAGDIRKIFMVHRTVPTDDPSTTREVFGLIAGVYRAADGHDHFYSEDGTQDLRSLSEVWKLLTVAADGIAFGTNPFSTICATRGNSETWTIENWTGRGPQLPRPSIEVPRIARRSDQRPSNE